MSRIALDKGEFALVEKDQLEGLVEYRWYCCRVISVSGKKYLYAMTKKGPDGTIAYMHRVILGSPAEMVIDHVNGNGLDNRLENLRICSHAENLCNRRKGDDVRLTSQYKGVSRPRARAHLNYWKADIQHEGRHIRLGRFENEIDAARAYDAAALRIHGEFACINFPI